MAEIDEFPFERCHMPFIADEPEGSIRCCCIWEGTWRAMVNGGDGWAPLAPDMPAHYTQCSPFVHYNPMTSLWEASLIAGDQKAEEDNFALYRIPNISAPRPEPVAMARAGFTWKGTVVTCGMGNPVTAVYDTDRRWQLRIKPARYIYRIIPDSNNPRHLLVSWQDWFGEDHSWRIAPEEHLLDELSLQDGTAPYKPCIYRTALYYAEKVGDNDEERCISKSVAWTAKALDFDSNINVSRMDTGAIDEEFE